MNKQQSDKLKYAFEVATAFSFSFFLPLYFGWEDVATAATTVMIIASGSDINESLQKGLIRVIGTVLGAALGLLLVALFPQERFIYLISLSLLITICAYLFFAYRGDGSVFMLTALTMMLVRTENIDNTMIFGLERTAMTILGIIIFTIATVYIFPIRHKKRQKTKALEIQQLFVWLDPEAIKGAMSVFFIFWATTLFWIYFHPIGGFYVVVLATVLSFHTTLSPNINPKMVTVVFSLSFIVATFAYIFVLTHLVYGWQLILFLFVYAFVSYYFIPRKIAFFLLLGVFVMGIANQMDFNFEIYMQTLFIFYLFLLFLMFLHNIPFSSQPEHLFVVLQKRFFTLAQKLENLQNKKSLSWLEQRLQKHYRIYLQLTVEKLKQWAAKIDIAHFDLNKEELFEFVEDAQNYLLGKNSLDVCYNSIEKINLERLKVGRF